MNECTVHPRAYRCFHRGDAWVAEYRYQNGHWKLDTSDPAAHKLRLGMTSETLPTNAEELFQQELAALRGIKPRRLLPENVPNGLVFRGES